MTASAGPALKRLHREFGDRVAFVTLYVREAHPGEHYPQAKTDQEKLAHARVYKERDGIPWPVAVDHVDGELHRMLDSKPNAAYLMDVHGNVAFRALWSNDEQVLRDGLSALASGQPVPLGEREPLVVPMLKGMGMMYEMLNMAGPQAKRDVLTEVPPMYAMARLAALFRPLPPLARGIAAIMTSTIAIGAIVGALRQVWVRRG